MTTIFVDYPETLCKQFGAASRDEMLLRVKESGERGELNWPAGQVVRVYIQQDADFERVYADIDTSPQSISLLRVSVGPHDTAVKVDPYWDAENWHEAARGDGHCYGGVVETVRRRPGESLQDLLARAEVRASELNRE